jgi:hypothetical protein
MMHSQFGNTFGPLWVVARKEHSMPDRQSLIETLRTTSAALSALRKSIAGSRHLDEMSEIDTLLAVAQTETDRRIAIAISRQARP